MYVFAKYIFTVQANKKCADIYMSFNSSFIPNKP